MKTDAWERHETVVEAPIAVVDEVVRKLDLSSSPVIRALFRLRSFGREPGLGFTREELLRSGFVVLEKTSGKRFALGLAGKFWRPSGEVRHFASATAFDAFDDGGHAKAVWDFTLEPIGERRTRLVTTTSVVCMDAAARRSFRRYWFFIAPFSGLIRRLLLRAMKRAAERS